MGKKFLDRYTLLHFATGVVAYHWGMSEKVFLGLHITFEFLENTDEGMRVIRGFPLWPGGKPHADSFLNMVGDTIGAWAGWRLAKMLEHS